MNIFILKYIYSKVYLHKKIILVQIPVYHIKIDFKIIAVRNLFERTMLSYIETSSLTLYLYILFIPFLYSYTYNLLLKTPQRRSISDVSFSSIKAIPLSKKILSNYFIFPSVELNHK